MRWSGLNGPFASHHSPASRAKRSTSSRSRVRLVSAIADQGPSGLNLSSHGLLTSLRQGQGRLRHAPPVSMKAACPAGPLNGPALLLWAEARKDGDHGALG